MLLTANIAAQKFQRVFACLTFIRIQVLKPGTLILSTNQGEANATGDGVQYTSTNTSGNSQPPQIRVKGDLWYSATIDGLNFVLLIDGEEGT